MTDSGRVDWRTLLTPGVLQTSAAEPEVRRGRTIVPPTSWRPRTISTAGHPPSSGGLVPESAVVEKDAAAKCRAYLAAAQKADLDGPGRAAQQRGRLLVGLPLQVTQQDGRPVLLRQPLHLFVQHLA